MTVKHALDSTCRVTWARKYMQCYMQCLGVKPHKVFACYNPTNTPTLTTNHKHDKTQQQAQAREGVLGGGKVEVEVETFAFARCLVLNDANFEYFAVRA